MNARRASIRAQAPGYAAANASRSALVGERDPVLDVRREVRSAGRRDDVDLERHPGRGAGSSSPARSAS